ncbi:recombinase family protein [Microbacterium sp. SORGH_AS_0862]|uniref:recombinase family protein n=1 Tax=Microbacterium sp. SORGH_AS_0862 TaxID=3041789 RepID=UPI00279440ED|nr:recombinase family protein [Microbacterium sp. SORGH_AS_0862]MDQ1205079.1 site-specific DNA recombinase [Microbacterium sp. SORGH_AS_0862]
MRNAAIRAAASTPRAILYLRQSTYREESISLLLQETACRQYCDRQGYAVVDVEADPGISGRTWQRPAVQRVMSAVEEGRADVIVLWRWSRLSRNRKHWAVAADRIDVAGGAIESATEPNDTTAAGRFGRGVMVEMNAFESERIGEQWKEVQESRFKRGLPPGTVPWGWLHNDDGTIAPNPDQAPAIPQLYEMYISGDGTTTLARWLEQHGYLTARGRTRWERCTVTSLLDSPIHSGQVTYHGETRPGVHEGLVSPETFERYRALRIERAGKRAPRANYLLSGLLTCGSCGVAMYGQTVRNAAHPGRADYIAYRCNSLSFTPEHGPGYVRLKAVEEAVSAWLAQYSHLEHFPEREHVSPPQTEAQRLAREIQDLNEALVKLTVDFTSGKIPERAYSATAQHYDARISTLSATLARHEASIAIAPKLPQASARLLLETWDVSSVKACREGLRDLIERITVHVAAKKVEIRPRIGETMVIDI